MKEIQFKKRTDAKAHELSRTPPASRKKCVGFIFHLNVF